jgi:uncharacterized RDD family membrane protein YckC
MDNQAHTHICPLCGSDKHMGDKAKSLYEHLVCRKCYYAFANRRHLAFAIDMIFWFVFNFALGATMALSGMSQSQIHIVGRILGFALMPVFLLKDGFDGQSPGKSFAGVQVLNNTTAQPAGFRASFKRNLPTALPIVPLFIALELLKGYRTGDGWAKTRVVWKKYTDRAPFALRPETSTVNEEAAPAVAFPMTEQTAEEAVAPMTELTAEATVAVQKHAARYMYWFYRKDGKQVGPIPSKKMRELLDSGELGPEELIWNESLPEWTPASNVESFTQRPAFPLSSSSASGTANGNKTQRSQVRPVVRFFARFIDINLWSFLAVFVLGIVFPQILYVPVLAGMASLFLWTFIEAFLLFVWGTTPGKWLLGIALQDSQGQRPSFSAALRRSFLVWWRGLGIGFPLAPFVTCILSYRNLKKKGESSWDHDCGLVVSHGKISAAMALPAALIVVNCLILTGGRLVRLHGNGPVGHSIVLITTYDQKGNAIGQGSGFFINPEGELVTNRHVLLWASRAEVKTFDGGTYPVGNILAEDEGADLVRAEVKGLPRKVAYLRLCNGLPRKGERIFVIGSPMGLEQTLTDGIVSAVREIRNVGVRIQISAPISPGSSGSPVFNSRGQVVGVATEQLGEGENINFAVPANKVLEIVSAPERTEPIRRWTEENIAKWQQSAEGIFFSGYKLLKNRDYEAAISCFEKAIKKDPELTVAYLCAGDCFQNLKRNREALEAYTQAVRLAPDSGLVHYKLASAYLRLGYKEAALKEYEITKVMNPYYASALGEEIREWEKQMPKGR